MISIDTGLLVLRVTIGLILAAHGSQKLFGWFGGYGLKGTAGFMGSALRLRPALIWTSVAALSEFAGGLLLAFGFLHPLGSVAIAAAMLAAMAFVHWPKFFASDNGIEYTLVLLVSAVALGLTGPGLYSLDTALDISLPAQPVLWAGLALGLISVAIAAATRAPAPAEERQPEGVPQRAQAA